MKKIKIFIKPLKYILIGLWLPLFLWLFITIMTILPEKIIVSLSTLCLCLCILCSCSFFLYVIGRATVFVLVEIKKGRNE